MDYIPVQCTLLSELAWIFQVFFMPPLSPGIKLIYRGSGHPMKGKNKAKLEHPPLLPKSQTRNFLKKVHSGNQK